MKKINYLMIFFISFFVGIFYISALEPDDVVDSLSFSSNYNGIVKYNNDLYYISNGKFIKSSFMVIENNRYYFNYEGKLLKGIATINNEKYYFDNNGVNKKGVFANDTNGNKYFFSSLDYKAKKGWFKYNNDTYYANPTSGIIAIGFKTIDSKKYYFDKNGIMQTGVVSIDNEKYYFDKNGVNKKGIFANDTNGNKYFFSSLDYKAKKGWFKYNNDTYYANPTSGIIATGFKTIDSKKYYFNKNGVLQTGIVIIDNKKYCFDKNGIMQTGVVSIDNEKYYFDKNGVNKKGIFANDTNGNKYFFSSLDYKAKKGWFKYNNDTYYANPTSGIVATGFKTIDSKKYYFDKNGVLQTGVVSIDNEKYYFDKNGVNKKGIFASDSDGNTYFFSSLDYKAKKGWFNYNSNKYYADKNTSELYTELHEIDSNTYFFQSDGKLVEGYYTLSDEINYYHFSNSIMDKGWYTYNGKKYYSDVNTGVMYFGEKTIDGIKYTFDSTGALVEESQNGNIKKTSEMVSQAKTLVAQNKSDYNIVLNLTNSYRSEVGVSNLVLDEDLSVAATIRAIEMAENNYYSHTRPNGSTCFTVLSEYGIVYYSAAENIAKGTDWYFTAEEVSNSWKNSSGHYSNMINSEYNKIGIGKYTYNGYTYWVQLFTN